MLALASRTPPGWAAAAAADPVALLGDHAHCELGAAASAQGLIHALAKQRDPALSGLGDRLAALAVEELVHFRRVLALLRERGGQLAPSPGNPYAEGLQRAAAATRRDGSEALLDRLLVAGLVEARSLERFERLAEEAADAGLRALYAELAPSERGHALLFADLAGRRYGVERAAGRAAELAELEACTLAALPGGPRIHSGPRVPSEAPSARAVAR